MRIACPYCGERDSSEFTYKGDAGPRRPPLRVRARNEAALPAAGTAMFDYVYIRENPAGVMQEWWHHAGGCHAWIRVERNVTTHEVGRTAPARVVAGRESAR